MALSAEKIRLKLPEKWQNIEIEVYKSLDSTNTFAKISARNAAHGSTIIAEEQTAGRGNRGKSFYSPVNGVYMSVILYRGKLSCEPGLVTFAAAVAVCRVLKKIANIDAQIKWVNDIFVNGRKVCGILTESVSNASRIIVGIGINAGECNFPKELEGIAGSIGKISRTEMIAALIEELLAISGENTDIIAEYSDKSLLLGREITYIQGDATHTAYVERIDHDGALVVLQDGETRRLLSGEVNIKL